MSRQVLHTGAVDAVKHMIAILNPLRYLCVLMQH